MKGREDEGRTEPKRMAVAWCTFAIFLAASLCFGTLLEERILLRLGVDLDQQVDVSGFELVFALAFVVASIIILGYLAVISWVLFARIACTREQVLAVLCYGPCTRFERWLVDLVFPEETTRM